MLNGNVMQPVKFYLRMHINPLDYGFKETDDGNGWVYRHGKQTSCVYISRDTRRIECNGVSSICLATLFRIAADNGIEILELDRRESLMMRLTPEEAIFIEKMRNGGKRE